ncbi:MAG TPA: hypothetical protein VLL06_09585 [Nitrospiraceae bacterium]|nr:hypothetical protein [Nitrospiraceae bacterium]
MRIHIVGIAALSLLSLPSLAFSQDQTVTGDKSVVFPPRFKCSTNSPCRNLTGEILRIEESYWIQDPGGGETHVRVTRDTKMAEIPKVGDKIAAQLTSNGDANAIVKLAEIPKPKELPVPARAEKDFRENQPGQATASGQAEQGSPTNRRSEAEVSGKVKSLDPLSGGGNIDPSSKMEQPTAR